MGVFLKPLTIRICPSDFCHLSISQIKYIWQILVELAGFPCHFVSSQFEGRVDVEYGLASSNNCVLHVAQNQEIKFDRDSPIGISLDENIEFMLWRGNDRDSKIIVRKKGSIEIRNDIVLTAFYLLSGAHDSTIPRNKIGDQMVESSFLYRQQILHVPIVNKYASLIAMTFKTLPRLNLWPGEKRYAAVVTHDIDYPEIYRSVETVRTLAKPKPGFLRKAWRIINGKVSFWHFNQWMEIETAAGVRSAFFFSGVKNSLLGHVLSAPDPFYDVGRKKYRILLKDMIDAGFEVGLHASYNSHRSLDALQNEKNKLEESAGQNVLSNRQHYWQSDPKAFYRTALLHHQVGLICDTTIGFERRCGFRYGIAAPFQFFNLDNNKLIPLVELPTSLMDDQLFGYSGLSYLGQPYEEMDELVSQVANNNGLMVVDFHGRILDETMFPGWRQAYERILAKISTDSDCWCELPVKIAEHYLKRKTILREQFKDEYRCND